MPNEVQNFLSNHPDHIAALAEELRQRIMALAPSSIEKLRPGWKAISYEGKKRVVCSVVLHKKWVNVQFIDGTSLEDSNRLLEGTGKTMRHVKISRISDIGPGLEALIIQSVRRAQ